MPGAVGAPLITAVMQRSMQSYLEREVRIPSGAAEYSRALIDQGYETPERFHQLSNAQLQKKFRWKEGHIAALNLFVENNPDVKTLGFFSAAAKDKQRYTEEMKAVRARATGFVVSFSAACDGANTAWLSLSEKRADAGGPRNRG